MELLLVLLKGFVKFLKMKNKCFKFLRLMKKIGRFIKKIIKIYFIQLGKVGISMWGPSSLYLNNVYDKENNKK